MAQGNLDEALGMVADKLKEIIGKHGSHSVVMGERTIWPLT